MAREPSSRKASLAGQAYTPPRGDAALTSGGGAGVWGRSPRALDPRETTPRGPAATPPERAEPRGRLPSGRQTLPQGDARRRSEEALADLGCETALDTCARLELEGNETAARALRRWVNADPAKVRALLALLPNTRGDVSRTLRLDMCGVAMLAQRKGETGFARRDCKDRLCPHCGARRSRRFAAKLREALAGRTDILFATFTKPKVAMEPPARAMDSILDCLRRFRERHAKHLVVGGVRSLEVTCRAAGAKVGDYTVRVPGVHAHLHCLLQLPAGALAACRCAEVCRCIGPCASLAGRRCRRQCECFAAVAIRAAWAASCEGASVQAVDLQPVSEGNIYQVGNYSLDMSGLLECVSGAPEYVRSVLCALHGRRLVATFGSWRDLDLGLREDTGTLVYGDRSVFVLATSDPTDAPPVKWADGRQERAEDVLAALLAGPREPLNARAVEPAPRRGELEAPTPPATSSAPACEPPVPEQLSVYGIPDELARERRRR